MTPLLESAGLSTQITELLLEAGANPNGQDADGWTPLATAAYRGSVPDVEMLLRFGADASLAPSAGDQAGLTPCQLAPADDARLAELLC